MIMGGADGVGGGRDERRETSWPPVEANSVFNDATSPKMVVARSVRALRMVRRRLRWLVPEMEVLGSRCMAVGQAFALCRLDGEALRVAALPLTNGGRPGLVRVQTSPRA